MTIEYIRYDIANQDAASFEAAYAAAAVPMAESPHCKSFELTKCVEEPNRYILRIEWDSLDGHMQGLRGSDHFAAFFEHIQPYVGAIDEMQHYETTAVVGLGAGTPQPPSRYEWAGGHAAIEGLFVHFYDNVLKDELLYPLFKDMDPDHPKHVAVWIGEVFGGPAKYTADHGGHPEMLRHHLNLSLIHI